MFSWVGRGGCYPYLFFVIFCTLVPFRNMELYAGLKDTSAPLVALVTNECYGVILSGQESKS